jgi:nucleotide-binding universal stress UspA family protein
VKTKVKVIKNVTVYSGNKTYGLGAIFDYEGDALDKLIEMGFVEKVGAPPPNAPPPKTAEEIAAEAEAAAKKAAEEAAKKRKKAEEAAVKKGLGTAEEIAALSDEDLQSLFKAKK